MECLQPALRRRRVRRTTPAQSIFGVNSYSAFGGGGTRAGWRGATGAATQTEAFCVRAERRRGCGRAKRESKGREGRRDRRRRRREWRWCGTCLGRVCIIHEVREMESTPALRRCLLVLCEAMRGTAASFFSGRPGLHARKAVGAVEALSEGAPGAKRTA